MIPELFKHQRKAAEFILGRGGNGALFMEMGTGKSRTAYEIFARLRENNPRLGMLIVAPLSLLEAAWREDGIKFGYPFSFGNLHEDFDLEGDFSILAINYEAVLRKSEKLVPFLKKGEWLCVLDESSRIKNSQSQITKTLLKMAPLFRHRIVMTGTPAPNSEMEYWPQMQFVEPGCIGTSMTAFRSHFFHLVNRYSGQTVAAGFSSRAQAAEMFRKCDYRITPQKREELMAMIMPLCHMAKKKDCLDLPDEIDEVRTVEMAPQQRAVYEQMKKTLIAEIRDQVIAAPVALTKIIKLRQIASGFIYGQYGEAFEMGPAVSDPEIKGAPIAEELGNPKTNPKIRELFDIIEEAGDQQAIIWISFHWEQIKICHELHSQFGPGSVVTLSALTKDRDGSIAAFKAGDARFLVAHPASAAHGLTFVNCSLQVFFSLDYSLEKYVQARARTHRAGQKKNCTYVHILAKNSIDEDIHRVLKKKGDAQEIIYALMRK